eukprot:scaffold38413_cov63-Phaeocystis_antarctica.AAC.1
MKPRIDPFLLSRNVAYLFEAFLTAYLIAQKRWPGRKNEARRGAPMRPSPAGVEAARALCM